MAGRLGRRSAGGFTLVELLVGIAILAAIGVAVASISLAGVTRISGDNTQRQVEATTAQWASMAFARDVQRASGAKEDPCGNAGVALVTLRASDSERTVTYWSSPASGAGPFSLIRTECSGGLTQESVRSVVDGLLGAPTVLCWAASRSIVSCATGGREVTSATLRIDQSNSFSFALEGTRRSTGGSSAPEPPLQQAPTFLALGGRGGGPSLRIGGNACLQVVGNAYVNRPAGSTVAIDFDGGARIEVTRPTSRTPCLSNPPAFEPGDFRLQVGGTCPGCSGRANPQPGSPYQASLPDPLKFLAQPPTSDLPVRSDCPVTDGVRVCEGGIYEVEFPPSSGGDGGVKNFVLRPGVYVLRNGVKINNGSLRGTGVLLFNHLGSIDVTGADLDLTPPNDGDYAGILVFQPASNDAPIKIIGNARLASLLGTLYAPESRNVILGGGGGVLSVGRVVGLNLEVSGNGTVVASGS
jgi:prepilin-type N-terminal cleavage/methylation domain-containing protein